jgi:hypothetical protein
LSPAVAQLSDAFRKGFVTTDQIMQRFSARETAQETAATETARAQTRQARALTPELIQARQTAELGGLEGQIAQQQLEAETRGARDKIFKAQVAQALDELETGLPAATLQQLEVQYPHIIKPQRDAQGRILNVDEVKSQIGHAVRQQKFLDQAGDLSKQFETKEVQTPGGQAGLQTFWKGTNQPVPPELVQMVNNAKTGALFGAGLQPGQVAAPTQVPTAPVTGVPAAPGQAQPITFGDAVSKPSGLPVFQPGTTTPEGVFITAGRVGGKLTETEGKALKFFRRMEESENFYTQLLRSGFEPTKAGNQAQRDIWSVAAKIPVVGAGVGQLISDDAKSYHNVVQGFTSAMLRDESGAAIRDDERAEYERMMFPLTEEPPEVVQQKARLRATVIASLRQVASGQISDEAYEQFIEETTGRQFPAATSVRSTNRLGEAASQGVAPDDIPVIQPGDPIPTQGWFWVEGEAQPRKAFQPRQAPPPQAAPAPPLSQSSQRPALDINPRFSNKTPTSVSGVRG